MSPQKKAAMIRSLRHWGASFAVVAGFIYYKSAATLGSVLLAGLLTFFVTVGRVWFKRDETPSY
jgi:hypothetical protein